MRDEGYLQRSDVIRIRIEKILIRTGFTDTRDDPEPRTEKHAAQRNGDNHFGPVPPRRKRVDPVASRIRSIIAVSPVFGCFKIDDVSHVPRQDDSARPTFGFWVKGKFRRAMPGEEFRCIGRLMAPHAGGVFEIKREMARQYPTMTTDSSANKTGVSLYLMASRPARYHAAVLKA